MTAMKLNVIELEKSEYTGGKSSMCPGCGHDQISNVIICTLTNHIHQLALCHGLVISD